MPTTAFAVTVTPPVSRGFFQATEVRIEDAANGAGLVQQNPGYLTLNGDTPFQERTRITEVTTLYFVSNAPVRIRAWIDGDDVSTTQVTPGTVASPAQLVLQPQGSGPVAPAFATEMAASTAFSSRYARIDTPVSAADRIVLVSGQAHESPTVTNCTLTADTTNVSLGARSHRLTMSGATTATFVLDPLPLGTLTNPKYTGAAVMIWLDNASLVSTIQLELRQNSGGSLRQALTFHAQIGAYGQPFVNGWNLIRLPNDYRRADFLVGGADMSAIVGLRVLIVTTGATAVSIGHIALETRPKASLLFINDGCYRRFFNDPDGYADLRARDIPCTLAVNVGMLGGADIITEARVAELARENRNSVSFHGLTTSVTASMTGTQLIAETVGVQQWLAARGYSGRMWRAAWLQNSATNSPATDPLVLANPMYTGGEEYVHMWPFSNPSHVQRTVLHGKSSAQIDAMFTAMERCRGVNVCYTHDVRADPTGIDMSIAQWDYFISKVDEGIAAGWLEGATFEMLMERSGLIPQQGLDGSWTVNYPDRTGTLVQRRLI